MTILLIINLLVPVVERKKQSITITLWKEAKNTVLPNAEIKVRKREIMIKNSMISVSVSFFL
jgi:hypothetical protein